MHGQIPQIDITELQKKMKDVAAELTAIHRELYWLAMQNGAPDQVPEELNIEGVTDFKSTVDNMRILLWKYLDAAAHAQPERVQDAMESHRLRRVTQLLQLLRESLSQTSDQPVSFIEKISAAIKERLKSDKAA
jgi:hypothetical protein